MPRKAKIVRKTKETNITVEANIDGKGAYKIETKIGFLNHMLEQLSKHSLIDLKVLAKGDTYSNKGELYLKYKVTLKDSTEKTFSYYLNLSPQNVKDKKSVDDSDEDKDESTLALKVSDLPYFFKVRKTLLEESNA